MQVVSYDLTKMRLGSGTLRIRDNHPVVLGKAGGLVATFERHSLLVWRAGPDISQCLNLKHTKPYTVCGFAMADQSGWLWAISEWVGRVRRDVSGRVGTA